MDLHSSHEIKQGYLYQTYLITLFQVSDIKMKLICGTLTRLILRTLAQCAVWQNVSYYRANAAIITKMSTRIDIKHKLGGVVKYFVILAIKSTF